MRASDAAFEELLNAASGCADRGEWSVAASSWTTAAGMARERGAEDTAAALFGTAGEAFRRADRPNDALNALQLGLAAGLDTVQSKVALSAVLASKGRMQLALQHAVRAGDDDLALDAQVAVVQAIGTRDEMKAVWSRLRDPIARGFREAQSLRMAGDLTAARDVLEQLDVRLSGLPAGRGAVRLERAEIDALQGRGAEAAEVFATAAADHRTAGRRALVWSTLACQVRCLLDAGVTPLGVELASGREWANTRGLEVLALDLSIVLGRMKGDRAALRECREAALTFGLVRRAGRAELALATLAPPAERMMRLQDAAHHLVEDHPLWLRARTAHAEALAALSPLAGARLAAGLVKSVERTGMEPELERLAALEESCSPP